MNTELHQYPAALYSAVASDGYRRERQTGEFLRAGRVSHRPLHAVVRAAWLRVSAPVRGQRRRRATGPSHADARA